MLNDPRTNPPGIIPDFHADLAMPPAIDRAPAQGRPLRYPHWSRDALPTRRLLFDVKTVYGGGTYYLGAWAARHQTGAVEARALAVSPAYEAHARELDEQYSRPQVRIQGPDGTWQSVPDASQPAGDGIRRLLGSFTRVRGLVFGQYGEWSLDVSHLISISARVQHGQLHMDGVRPASGRRLSIVACSLACYADVWACRWCEPSHVSDFGGLVWLGFRAPRSTDGASVSSAIGP